jgi:hypothetical protein
VRTHVEIPLVPILLVSDDIIMCNKKIKYSSLMPLTVLQLGAVLHDTTTITSRFTSYFTLHFAIYVQL